MLSSANKTDFCPAGGHCCSVYSPQRAHLHLKTIKHNATHSHAVMDQVAGGLNFKPSGRQMAADDRAPSIQERLLQNSPIDCFSAERSQRLGGVFFLNICKNID